jgi:hypothetical protein
MRIAHRPDLRPVPVGDACRPGTVTVTMSEGQWDPLLAVAYDMGFTLLELDADERPVAAYRKAGIDAG